MYVINIRQTWRCTNRTALHLFARERIERCLRFVSMVVSLYLHRPDYSK